MRYTNLRLLTYLLPLYTPNYGFDEAFG